MNRKELNDFFINDKPIPKGIPCGFWMHFPSDCNKGNKSIKLHCDYYDQTDIPILKIMNEHPLHIDTQVTCPEDWEKIKHIDVLKSDYVNYLEEIREIRKERGENAFILATIHGVLVSACHATDGMGKFPDFNNTVTRHLKQNPELVSKGLRQVGKTLTDLSLACIEAGADGIYYAALGAEEERFSKELYENYVKPIEVSMLSEVMKHGVVFLHICKDYPRISMFNDYPCHVVNWTEHCCHTSLEEAVTLFKDRKIMCGFDNKPGSIFLEGKTALIEETIDKLVAFVGKDRLVIGADCTLPGNTDLSIIRNTAEYCSRI